MKGSRGRKFTRHLRFEISDHFDESMAQFEPLKEYKYLDQKVRRWTFTYHPKGSDTWNAFTERLALSGDAISYVSVQEEIGGKTKKYHWQGYAEFPTPTRFGRAGYLLGCIGAHFEASRGTAKENASYTTKESFPGARRYRSGTPSRGQGARSDLDTIAELVQSGSAVRSIAAAHPASFIRYGRGIERLVAYSGDTSYQRREVYVLFGRTGTGKTRMAFESSDDVHIIAAPENASEYILGYTGQRTCIFDDFYSWIRYSKMLNLLDGYPFPVNTLGNVCLWNPRVVWITTNANPLRGLWPSVTDKSAFIRRVTRFIYFPRPGIFAELTPAQIYDLP